MNMIVGKIFTCFLCFASTDKTFFSRRRPSTRPYEFLRLLWYSLISYSLKSFRYSWGTSYIPAFYELSRSVSLAVKGKLSPASKRLKTLWTRLSAKFSLALHILISSSNCFFKSALHQSWKDFNPKFGPQWKAQESTDQVSKNLALFYKLVALILGYHSVKDLRFMNVFK